MKPYALFPRTPGLFSSLNVQKNMLQDRTRIERFKDTIFRKVRKGDVVVDLGTGTGILAIYAAQAGAKKVYAIEETDVADVAKTVIESNGFSEAITVLKANSSQVILPEAADVLIAEVVGHFLFEEGIVEAISGARDSLLKPGGIIMPMRSTVFLAPVELNPEFTEISYWGEWKDPDLSVIRKKAANSAYVETVRPENLLAEPAEIFDVNFETATPAAMTQEVEFRCNRDGRLCGLAGWFRLWLDGETSISTSPSEPATHWQQCVFPLESPVNIVQGDVVYSTVSIEPFAPGCKWRWELKTGAGGQFAESHEFAITYGQDARLIKERF